ncbi:InlB B-repeat-containing protein [Chloroflexota bacterium]
MITGTVFGGHVTVPNEGYDFAGWSDWGVLTETRTDTNVTGDIDVTAIFGAKEFFTLTYTAEPDGSITGETTQQVEYGLSGTPVTAVPNEGYHFVSWNDDSTINPRRDSNVTQDISVTAIFAIDTINTLPGSNVAVQPANNIT